MIHIDLEGKAPPKKLIQEAKTVTKQLYEAKTPAERNVIIKKNEKLWGKFKEWLLEQSQNKCWYTEARNDSSHFEVEHFRPKKWRNTGKDEFEGYWWLAFNWNNYRVCGNAPNRKKGAFFPLHPDSKRASSDKPQLIDDELFTLLDPIEFDDTQLLSFDNVGLCTPAPGCDGWEKTRARVSIDRYGLNSLPQLWEGRQHVWQDCRRLIEEIAELHKLMSKTPTVSCRTTIKEKIKHLREKIDSKRPFSAVARACFIDSGYYWAQSIANV